MSQTITEAERVKVAKWILENFDVNQENMMIKVPIGDFEATWIPLRKVVEALAPSILEALRLNEDPWIHLVDAEVPAPPTTGLVPCAKCGGIIRTKTPEEHFNTYLKRLVSDKLKVKPDLLSEVDKWLG